MQQILRSPEYVAWLKEEQDRALDQVGMIFTLLDQITGLPTSAIYRTAVDLWRGSDDYLGYLKNLSSFLPGGREVAKTVERAVDLTEKARDGLRVAEKGPEAIGNALLNTGTRYAKQKVGKQLAFFENELESTEAAKALEETGLMREPLPEAIKLVDDAVE
jgi:hypothetical protein